MANRHRVKKNVGGLVSYSGGESKVAKEAREKKDGGRAYKCGGKVMGKASGGRLDKRARGGSVMSSAGGGSADKSPMACAAKG